jgi:peptide/nickel transport system substrate-binding protein
VDRRAFLPLIGVLFLVTCGSPPDQVSTRPTTTATDTSERQAPSLTALVASGNLPPLERRLPTTPLIARHDYPGYKGTGRYGGTWYRFHTSPSFGTWKMTGGYAPLVRWRFDCKGLEPGLAQSWAFNEDGTELTIKLREGLRWSDGHPYTSASFKFWYDLCLDDRHQYTPPVWCLVDGMPMVVTTPDDRTIHMRFAGPNWLVPLWLATGFGWSDRYNIPVHYMKQLHPDHSDHQDFNAFIRQNKSHQNIDRPSMWPWILARYERGGFLIELERNPYYYIVDDEGRQLPYIDRVRSSMVQEEQVRVLKALAGELDCQFRGFQLRDLSLFLRGAERGDYQVRKWKTASGALPAILVNWTDPDPALRVLLRDQRFRKALAFGIDRDRCNEIAWKGLLQPQAATVSQEGWHFSDTEGQHLFNQWKQTDAEFNLVRGSALLDEMGLTRRDGEGYRLRPDGQRLSLVMDVPTSSVSRHENDIALIIQQGWGDLGIETVLHTPPGAERSLRRTLGEYTISMHGEAEMDLFTYPDWVFPTLPKYWHPRVGKWYQTGGTEGEPPTGPLKRLLDLYDRIKRERDLDKRHQLVRDAIQIHIDEGPFHLGTVGRAPMVVIVSDRFHNVPDTGILGPWAIATPATSFPEQFYIQDPVE